MTADRKLQLIRIAQIAGELLMITAALLILWWFQYQVIEAHKHLHSIEDHLCAWEGERPDYPCNQGELQ